MENKIKISRQQKDKMLTTAPAPFIASRGDFKGEIDLLWDPLSRAHYYIIELAVYSENLNWVQFDIITKSSSTISGLKSGKKYCFRICAVNSFGKGPWSRIISKSVP